jgi:Aldehyde ferredoxin oxidoreductase, N-terminal domain
MALKKFSNCLDFTRQPGCNSQFAQGVFMLRTEGGYWGRALRVDLTNGEICKERMFDKELRMVIGGSGYGAKVLYLEVPASVKPSDPGNRMVFAPGPWTVTTPSVAGTAAVRRCRAPSPALTLPCELHGSPGACSDEGSSSSP